ncbi:MAG: polyphosphate polymerase domain-containing protein [Christensenellales bacterium]
MENTYRHELKYYINEYQHKLLQTQLKATLPYDENANKQGEYHIRSLYFDDIYESALMTKVDGEDERTKYRIRIYKKSDEQIKLERKGKTGGYTHKEDVTLTREDCDSIIAGDMAVLLNYDSPAARGMYLESRLHLMKPVVIVDYMREAYVFPAENVRITFDKHIQSGLKSTDLFNFNIPMFSVLDDYDMVLEVKYDELLPAYIRGIIQIKSMQRAAISKYAICRRFEI